MSAPAAPTPEVDLKVRVEVVPVPPITNGSVMPVVKVGEVPNTLTPVPVSSVKASRRLADTPLAAKFEDASVNKAREAVKPVNVTVEDALRVPVISRVVAGAVLPIPTFPLF
jgi:hypothetical protein